MATLDLRPALVVALTLGASMLPAAPDSKPAPFDLDRFTAVDTTSLLGSPDPLPPLELEKVFPALSFRRPVALTNAADGSGRLFVCDQEGIVWVFPDDPEVETAKVFLDISDRAVFDHFEEGLLGLAFHPRYEENGTFFVYYSTRPRASIVARYQVSSTDPNRAEADSEVRLLEIPQPFGNHNGGSIEFGPDGYLYIGLGDGGKRDDPHENAQNLGTLLGSILRIDVDRREDGKEYAIPPDNPFVGAAAGTDGSAARAEIFAYGIRNPWRLTFDRLSGLGWIADVGQDQWEEIDILAKGANYGWNLREGRHPWKPEARRTGDELVEPIFEYPRSDGKSITGGYVYRGARFPELYGAYFYGDFVSFNLWALRFDGKEVTSNHLIARSRLPVTAFGEGEDGELYLTAFEAGDEVDTRELEKGDVFRLERGGIYRFRRRQGEDVDTAAFPRRLSETGLFVDLEEMVPAPGLIPYSVNVPLWSDGAEKIRYLALPAAGTVRFDETGAWELPVGAVLVKTFTFGKAPEETARLETRLLVRSERGWAGYTYLWNPERTDAQLLDTALRRTYAVPADDGPGGGAAREQEWYFPSRSDCSACHTSAAGYVLGLSTRQLNRVHDYGSTEANQLDVLARLGVFEDPLPRKVAELEAYPAWETATATADELARAYLDANCAMCHAPGGTGLSKADLRFHTPLEEASLVGQEPGQGRLGGPGTSLLTPGSPYRSELLLRMMQRGGGQMPTLASDRIDWRAVAVIGGWIEELGSAP